MNEESKKKRPAAEKKVVNIVEEPLALYGRKDLNLDLSKRYSYADYLTWFDNKRRELYDGIIQMMSGPNRMHAKITSKMLFLIEDFITKKGGNCEAYHAPFDVRLPKNKETADDKIYTVVQPDICVICDLSKLDDKGCIGAPDLVVEVLSPSTGRRDLDKKLKLYEEAGVPEYWVVFPAGKAITVFLLQDGMYDDGIAYEYDAKVPVQTLPGLEIELKQLLTTFSD